MSTAMIHSITLLGFRVAKVENPWSVSLGDNSTTTLITTLVFWPMEGCYKRVPIRVICLAVFFEMPGYDLSLLLIILVSVICNCLRWEGWRTHLPNETIDMTNMLVVKTPIDFPKLQTTLRVAQQAPPKTFSLLWLWQSWHHSLNATRL